MTEIDPEYTNSPMAGALDAAADAAQEHIGWTEDCKLILLIHNESDQAYRAVGYGPNGEVDLRELFDDALLHVQIIAPDAGVVLLQRDVKVSVESTEED